MVGPRLDCRYLVPVAINTVSRSELFQETIKDLHHYLINQDHLHQTAILIVPTFLLPLFLRTKITLSIQTNPIHFEILDYPSEDLLILLSASFLLPPTLFWKVFVIVVSASPYLRRRFPGMVRRSGEWIANQIGRLCGSPSEGQGTGEPELGNGQPPPSPAQTSISISDE